MNITDNHNNEQENAQQANPNKEKGSAFGEKLKAWARYTKTLFRIHEDTDAEATMASIHKSVEFRGINVWP